MIQKKHVHEMAIYVKEAGLKFRDDHGTLMAAAVSFYTSLSLIPILLLGVTIFAVILGSSEKAYAEVLGYFHSMVPVNTFFLEHILHQLIGAGNVLGVISVVSLLWTSSQVFVTLEMALNIVWKVPVKRHFVHSRFLAFWMLLLIGVSLFITMTGGFTIAFIHRYPLNIGGHPGLHIPSFVPFLTSLGNLILSIAMFTVMYRMLPNCKIHWDSALIGGAFAGVGWEIAKWGYQLYLLHFANFGKFYGSLASVMILILWLYYSAGILLFCGELSYVYQRKKGMPPNGRHNRKNKHGKYEY